ncbi:MAG TPA: lipopolysaccharide transport periplasmic protein LptA [Gammaproteobacteria bacterium]
MRSRWLLVALSLLAIPAYGSEASLTVSSHSVEADRSKGISVFTGEVRIDKGGIHIEADEARLRALEGVVQEGTLIGRPAKFRQQPEGAALVTGEAERIEYDAVNEIIVLTGNAWVRQGEDEFRAETIRYDIATEKVLATSPESAKERVTIIFQPKNDEPDNGEQESAPPRNQNQNQENGN